MLWSGLRHLRQQQTTKSLLITLALSSQHEQLLAQGRLKVLVMVQITERIVRLNNRSRGIVNLIQKKPIGRAELSPVILGLRFPP